MGFIQKLPPLPLQHCPLPKRRPVQRPRSDSQIPVTGGVGVTTFQHAISSRVCLFFVELAGSPFGGGAAFFVGCRTSGGKEASVSFEYLIF